ncbi:MAG: dienelactone hydrolase family protein [Spirochaetaceae bacterium]|nr:dienelactone hydrolase family protein [Spirochaetaceae bacterium]
MKKADVQELLGGPWPDPPSLETEILETVDRGDFMAERISYQLEADERVEAWLLIPKASSKASDSGLPGVAVWHQHNDEYHLGKSESAGFDGNPMHHTGPLLAREGYVVLCPDALGFESRRHKSLDGPSYERHMAMHYLTAGKSIAWKNILDNRRALDYLCSRSDVDVSRIGCYGHSLGSTFTWLTGPWDERLKCMVGNCCMPSQAAMDGTAINHSFSNYIPGLNRIGDIPDYVALTAPRRLHLNFGAGDVLNPVDYLKKELPQVAALYKAAGAEDAFSLYIDNSAEHELSESMKKLMLEVFRENL